MKKLHQLGVVDNYDLECALKEICCQNNNQESPKKDCCYRKCDSCCDKTCIPLTQENVNTYDQQQIVTYFQWKQTLKTYETENGTKEYKNIAKVEITQELGDLIDEFEHDLERYARHSYNIRHQFQAYRKYKQCLTDKMCVIHIDFSENYASMVAEKFNLCILGEVISRQPFTLVCCTQAKLVKASVPYQTAQGMTLQLSGHT